jgi:multicomponent Na+:H+ antiporter subunit E
MSNKNNSIESMTWHPQNLLIVRLRSTSLRLILFALLWWILTDGSIDSWMVGVPVVLLVTWVSMQLLPALSLSLRGLLQFIPFFLWHSLVGGVDVASRAFHPRLPISPGIIDYPWRLPAGLPRVLMANTVSLLPGTLSMELDDHRLCVHVLDNTASFTAELAIIEQRVSKLFGLYLMIDRSED